MEAICGICQRWGLIGGHTGACHNKESDSWVVRLHCDSACEDFMPPEYPLMITLRDFFAGCALIGFVRDNPNWKGTTYAPWCYELADAMLKEREK